MDLKDFTKQVVKSVVEATEELSTSLDRDIHFDPIGKKHIEFDVAVTVENKEGKSNEGGINVWNVMGVKGGSHSGKDTSTVNRIQFSLIVPETNSKLAKQRKELLRQS